jgi:hypothetical protein
MKNFCQIFGVFAKEKDAKNIVVTINIHVSLFILEINLI